jgi:hypothetical protein
MMVQRTGQGDKAGTWEDGVWVQVAEAPADLSPLLLLADAYEDEGHPAHDRTAAALRRAVAAGYRPWRSGSVTWRWYLAGHARAGRLAAGLPAPVFAALPTPIGGPAEAGDTNRDYWLFRGAYQALLHALGG